MIMLATRAAMTPLDKTLKRAIRIQDRDFVVTLTPNSLKLTQKGHRLGLDLPWESMVNGDSALAVALQASLAKLSGGPSAPSAAPKKPKTARSTKTHAPRSLKKRKPSR